MVQIPPPSLGVIHAAALYQLTHVPDVEDPLLCFRTPRDKGG